MDVLLRHAGRPVDVQVDPSRLRAVDSPAIVYDAGKLFERTGWRPSIDFERTVLDTFEYWRARLRSGGSG